MTTCRLCTREFPPGERGNPIYCPAHRAGTIGVCPQCEEPFTRKQGGAIYCSTSCSRTWWNQNNPDHQSRAGKAAGKVRGQQLKEQAFRNWYVREGGTFVHRTIAEAVLGRSLAASEVVHHEDEDKQNNHPYNLIVFPDQAGHARHHKLQHCGAPCDCTCTRLKEVMPNATS